MAAATMFRCVNESDIHSGLEIPWEMTMIGSDIDSRTLTLMNMALDQVCSGIAGGGDHAMRKRAAKQIMRCAKSGPATLSALIEAGQHGLDRTAVAKTSAPDQVSRPLSDRIKAMQRVRTT